MGLPLKTVVVADDEQGIRDLLKRVLSEGGYDVLACATNGQEAVELTKLHKPHLLIMDVHMPEMDGLKAAKAVVGLSSTAIVLLTADQNPILARQALDLGVCAYMTKPFELAQLVPILESAWHHFQTTKTLHAEVSALQETLETRKLLEKAKGILMEQQGFSEQEAHQTIQKMSQDQGVSIKELCRSLIQVRMVLGAKPGAAARRKAA